MNIGVLKERKKDENRVSLTPAAVATLINHNHQVCVEAGAGERSGYPDELYEDLGATIVYSSQEVVKRSQLLLSISRPEEEILREVTEEQVVGCFWHFVTLREETVKRLMERKITCLGYEIMETPEGNYPILEGVSELAGTLTASIAQYLLQVSEGGRGVLLGGAPGVPPSSCVIIGGGVLGQASARAFSALGAQVMVLDKQVKVLRSLHRQYGGRITTGLSTQYNLKRALTFADVVIGAAAIHGERAPIVITREMVQTMRAKSVFIDASIDQGGISETSRPTHLSSPTYEVFDVIHYCVPNMTSNIPRTATRAITASLLPLLLQLGEAGLEQAFETVYPLKTGVYLFRGKPAKPWIAPYFHV